MQLTMISCLKKLYFYGIKGNAYDGLKVVWWAGPSVWLIMVYNYLLSKYNVVFLKALFRFWININDLPDVYDNTMFLFSFADDTNLFISGQNSHKLSEAANNDHMP